MTHATPFGTHSVSARNQTINARGHDRTQALKALTMGRPVVYAARLADGTIKIGCSASVWDRRRSLGIGAELIGFVFGTIDDEQAIHESLAAHRSRGREYYHPAPAVMAVVNEMRDRFGLPHIAA